VGVRRVDFFVENKISVEIKATTELTNINLAQGKNYLEAYNLEVGLLIILVQIVCNGKTF
jgi:GxxExxY protein